MRTLTLLLMLLLAACSRTSDKAPLTDAVVTLGPTLKDSQVSLAPLNPESYRQALELRGNFDTASYLRLAENLRAISENEKSAPIDQLSRNLVESFYAQPQARTTLSNSLYLSAIVGEGEPEVQEQLGIVAKEISQSIGSLTRLLDDSQKNYPWPRRLDNLPAAITAVDGYAVWLVDQIGKQKLNPSIAKPVQGAIKGGYQQYRPTIVKTVQSLQNAKQLGQALVVLKSALKTYKIDLGAEANKQIRDADALAASLASMKSPQNALALTVQIWRMIPAADRKDVFASVPEIYDFLNGKSELTLACLAAPICLNPIVELPRIVILTKISQIGVGSIRTQVDSAARDYLIKAVREKAVDFLPQVPGFIKTVMLTEAKKYQNLVGTIQKDFPGFARKKFDTWAKSNFPEPVRGLETNHLNLTLTGTEKISVKLDPNPKDAVVSGAETMGLSLAVAQEFLPSDKSPAKLRAALLAPVMKLLAISGFRKPGGKTFSSLLFPLDGPRDENFNIKDLLKGHTSFAVPTTFTASTGFALDRSKLPGNSDVGAQAELLRGISRQIRFHRDWEKNLFDEQLGSIQVEDVVPEVPKGAIDFSVFPKDVVFALSVGSAGAILQNIIRDMSPAFLMLGDNQLLWGNDYLKIGDGKISTVAGLVNIENGQRGRTVKTADVARYILAVDEFLSATKGIEKTKAAPLLSADDKGVRVVDQLIDARRYLRLFQMGLTNFLVYVAQDKDGGFHSTYTLDGKLLKDQTPRTLEDQVLAIRALNASADRLGLRLFSWAALDGYYFMNKKMWDNEAQFYAASISADGEKIGAPTMIDIAATLRGIEELSPSMTGEVRGQWEKINRPWLRALEDF